MITGGEHVSDQVDLTILIPAWNEADNLRELLPSIGESARSLGLKYEIIVVDPGSTDGTETVVQNCGYPARLVLQKSPGFGGAVVEGFAAARGEYILTMDADLSHHPSFLPDFWKARLTGDVILGSRYMPGGQAEMPFLRSVLSPILNAVFRVGLSLPWHDLSSGFRLYHSGAVKNLRLNSRDFDVLQEILIRCYTGGNRIQEIPIRYRPRRSGKSHAELMRFALAYLRTFFRMYRLRNANRSGHV
jgi:dolichol-phosphate mannosyltransferase